MALIDSEQIVPLPPGTTNPNTISDAIIQLQSLVGRLVDVTIEEPDIPEPTEPFDPSSIEQRLSELEDNPAIQRWFGDTESRTQGWYFPLLGLYFQVGRVVMTSGGGSHNYTEEFPTNTLHVLFNQDRLPPHAQTQEQAIDSDNLRKTGFDYHNLNSNSAPIAYLAIGY